VADSPTTTASTSAAAPPARHVPRGFFVAGEILAADLTPAEKLLLGLMATLARQSGQAYASVDTYALRLGVNSRTVQRLLRDLERRGFIVQDRPGGGGRRAATVYRLRPPAPDTAVPRQIAAPTGKASPDKADPDPRQFAAPKRRASPDKSGPQPRQIAAQGVDEGRDNNRGEGERPPAPQARAARDNNGDGDSGHDPDAALLALAVAVRGRPLTGREATTFAQAVAEAREKGATDAAIADETRKAGPDAPIWAGPNLARDAAGGKLAELLTTYQRAARLPRPRTTLAEIVVDVRYAQKCLARTPQPAPGDEGVALWNAQVAWATAHPEVLAAATGRREMAAVGVPA